MKNSLLSSLQHNIGGQLISRMISFLINMYLLRVIDGSVLGLVNVSLTLFYTTTIFLVREPFRKTFLSSKMPVKDIFNNAWLAPICYLVIASIMYFCMWLPFSTTPPTSIAPSYSLALQAFGLAALLEAIAEPYILLLLKKSQDAQYALLQGLLVVSQRVYVLILLFTTNLLPIYIFCLAQVLSSLTYLIFSIYFCKRTADTKKTHISLRPRLPRSFLKQEMSMLSTFMLHSAFKQILTDGTGYILAFTKIFTLKHQAVYDAVERLGSLVARIAFAPAEHSAYLFFSSSLERTRTVTEQNLREVQKTVDALLCLLHFVVVCGTVVFVFSLPYAPLAVSIYGGNLLRENAGADILRFYGLYIVIIAVNGIIECFAMTIMDQGQIFSHGWFLFLVSILQIIFSFVFSYKFGAFGLISANIITMIMRIAYSYQHIRRFLLGNIKIMKILPNFSTLSLLALCLLITMTSLIIFGNVGGIMHNAAHVAVGGTLFILVAGHIYQNDVEFVKFFENRLEIKHSSSD